MTNAQAKYKNAEGEELELRLDIDLSSQKICDVQVRGPLKNKYAIEMNELESFITGKTIDEAMTINRKHDKALASLSIWLMQQAIENYLGTENVLAPASDRLCLCFGLTERDLKKQILKRPDYELKNVIAETFASSACGSCLPAIKKSLEEIRLANGLIAGMNHSKGRFDKDGKWVLVKGLFPGPLLIWLDDLKQKWMKRENIQTQFSIEFTSIEGLHLQVSIANTESDRAEKILQALSDYIKSETGILFFLHLV